MKREDKKLIVAGGFAGVLGALCCIGPVIIVLLGLGSISTALTIGRYSWLFTAFALIFFGAAAYLHLKKKDSCSADGLKQNWKTIVVSFALLIILLISIKYWIAPLLAQMVYR